MLEAKKNEFQGTLLILAASMLWAGGYLFRKTVLYGISPLLLTFLTSAIVAVTFSLIFRLSPRTALHAFWEHSWLYAALALTGVIGSTCMFIGLDELNLGVSVVLEKLQPIFTFLLAWLLLKERLSTRKIPFMIIAIVASYFVSIKDPFDFTFTGVSLRGIGAVILAAFTWSFTSVIGKKLTKVQPNAQIITLLRFTLGSIMLFPFFILRARLGLQIQADLYVLVVVALCALFSTGLGYLLFYRGLKSVTATVSGFLELVTPVVGAILGILFLHERFTVLQLVAALVLLTSIYQLCRPDGLKEA
jgi:drug/metabolite transporter (DMT)-like permease